MSERELLPTREQIAEVSDAAVLSAWRDEILLQCTRMETDLEFSSRDEEWAQRAMNALALHRFTNRLIGHRLRKLGGERERPKSTTTRPADETSPLTLEVMHNFPQIDVAAIDTVEEIDRQLAFVGERADAVASDRTDEIGQNPSQRDEGFLSATGSILPRLRQLRSALQTRRGQISRAAKQAASLERDASREQLFIDAARERLPREIYVELWNRVDQMEAARS